jgi:hypothetical protein
MKAFLLAEVGDRPPCDIGYNLLPGWWARRRRCRWKAIIRVAGPGASRTLSLGPGGRGAHHLCRTARTRVRRYPAAARTRGRTR